MRPPGSPQSRWWETSRGVATLARLLCSVIGSAAGSRAADLARASGRASALPDCSSLVPHYPWSSVGAARRRGRVVACQQPPVVRSAQFGDRQRSRPLSRRVYRNRGKRQSRGALLTLPLARRRSGVPLGTSAGRHHPSARRHDGRPLRECADLEGSRQRGAVLRRARPTGGFEVRVECVTRRWSWRPPG
jgi:hypothetical protein